MDKSLVNKARRILASVLITALCVCNMAVPAFAEEAVAASFRLYQTEGTVTVQNQNGKEMTAMQDMKLFNGYQVSTEQKSYAWFEADSTKLFKMDAVSNLEVRKKGKQSELLLNSGNLFFNVTEHLQDDEVLNIRTSSMVVGIRGTSGWVKVIDQYHTILYMLDGSVEASVTDPVSDQRKSITLRGGQRAEFWIYDKNKEGDKCDIIVRQYGEEEIDGFVAVELKKDPQLQDRIRGGGSGAGGSDGGGTGAGFDLVSTIAKAEERLKQDQEEVARKLEEIKKQLAGLAHKVDVDPVFSNNTSKDDSGSDGGASGGSATTPEESIADPTTLTMPVTDDTVHDYLNNKNVSVILQPGSNASDNVLTVDSGLTVPSGKSLTAGNGISADVQNGQTLQVNGHMEMEGNLTNAGTVNNTSANTLQIGGDLNNDGTLDNSTGRLIIKGTFSNSGELINGNIIENSNAVKNVGIFNMNGGTVGNVEEDAGEIVLKDGKVGDITLTGGVLEMQGGEGGKLSMSGASIVVHSAGKISQVEMTNGQYQLNGGYVLNGIKQSNTAEIQLSSGQVEAGTSEVSIEMEGESVAYVDYVNTKIISKRPGRFIDHLEKSQVWLKSEPDAEPIFCDGNVYSKSEGNMFSLAGAGLSLEEYLETEEQVPEILTLMSSNYAWPENTKEITVHGEKTVELNGTKVTLAVKQQDKTINIPDGASLTMQYTTNNGSSCEIDYGQFNVEENGTLKMSGVRASNLRPIRLGGNVELKNSTIAFSTSAGNVNEKNYAFQVIPSDSAFIKAEKTHFSLPVKQDDESGVLAKLLKGANLTMEGIEFSKNANLISAEDGFNLTLNNCELESTKNSVIEIKNFNGNCEINYEKTNYLSSNSSTCGAISIREAIYNSNFLNIYPENATNIKGEGTVIRQKYEHGFGEYFEGGANSNFQEKDGWYYLLPDENMTPLPPNVTPLPQQLDIPLRPVVDEIVDSSLLATKNDADIIDEDFGYEEEEDEENLKATPNNATWSNDEIVDEDEPYQDSDDDEDDDEPRNIPVKSVTPAIPSTLLEDTVTSEEDPDSKKDENTDANNPEQEEKQNGDRDSGPEEEPESEKEKANLLHTEPSNVPDPREEEES